MPDVEFPEEWRYRRQFVVGPRTIPEFQHWLKMQIGESLHLSCHPHLNTATSRSGPRAIVMLGHVMDPEHPHATDADILDSLLAESESYVAFERATGRLSGRWLMFVQIGNDLRLYPDAAGSKSTFYVADRPDLGLWAATQPRLLAPFLGLKADRHRCAEFLRAHAHDVWPGETTPFPDMRQLLPNHYLDLRSGKARRFWPCRDPAEHDLDSAAALMARKFHGTIASALHRRGVVLPLTGGYDSRALMSAAGELRKSVSPVTILHPDIRYADILLSAKIARRLGLPHRKVRVRKGNEQVRRMFRMNVGDMFWDPGLKWAQTFREFDGNNFVLTGNDAAILRANYYRDGRIAKPLTSSRLATLAGYPGNPVAEVSCQHWLDGLPPLSDSMLLDLFHWEFRVGNWAALAKTLLDTVCEVIVPYNCRELLEAGLGVRAEHRIEPVRLFRRLYEMTAPEIADLPVNDVWQDRFLDKISTFVPWRIRDRVRKWRLKSSGYMLGDTLPPKMDALAFPAGRGYDY